MSYLGTDQLSISAQALALANAKKIDYEKVNSEHASLLHKIRQHEEEKQAEPTDAISVSLNLQAIETCTEYIEDPRKVLARDIGGSLFRCKLKITLSYSSGANPISPLFKFVQVNLEYPSDSVFCE